MPQIARGSTSKVSNKTITKIYFNTYKGVFNSNVNIVVPNPQPEPVVCELSLDFSCEDNSQYIPII